MTTFAPLAGATLPSDRSWDGIDLGPVLFDGSDTGHSTLYHPNGKGELNAMRYGDYKVFFQSYAASSCGGKSAGPVKHDPPLAFNVATDPAESTPVTLTAAQLAEITNAHAAKLNDIQTTYKSVADYSSGGIDAEACCNKSHVVCRCDN
jgi:arylsulfatase G